MRIVRFKITAIVLALVMTMTCGSALAWADAGGGINGGVGAGGSLLDQMKMVPLYDRAGKQYEIRFCYIDKPYKQFGNYDEEVAYLQGVDKKPVDVKVITNAFPGCSSGELCSTLRIDGGKNYKKGNLIVGEIVCPEDRENVPVYFTMTDSTGKTHAFDGKTSNSAYLTTWFYLSDNCDLTISVGHKHEVKTDGSNQSSGSEQTTQPASTTGKWVKSGSLWWYRYSDGSYPKSCAKTIDGATYRFDSAGWMRTGWIQEGNTWYFHHGSGAMAKGWLKDGAWYYLDPSSGAMQTGKNTIGGATYFLTASGAMKTGWNKEGNIWYYYHGSGAMAKGWLNSGGTWYYLGSDGSMQTGKKTIGGATYFLTASGAMKTGWNKEGNIWYYYHGSGAMKTGWIHSGAWYYLDPSDGAMKTGFYDANGSTYYSSSSGVMLTGWVHVGGKWYYLAGSGAMQKSRWIGNYWVGNDGVMATSSWVDNERYYVGTNGAWVPNAKK